MARYVLLLLVKLWFQTSAHLNETDTIQNEPIPNVRHVLINVSRVFWGNGTHSTIFNIYEMFILSHTHISHSFNCCLCCCIPHNVNQSNYMLLLFHNGLTFNSCVKSTSSTVDIYSFQIWQILLEKLFVCVSEALHFSFMSLHFSFSCASLLVKFTK